MFSGAEFDLALRDVRQATTGTRWGAKRKQVTVATCSSGVKSLFDSDFAPRRIAAHWALSFSSGSSAIFEVTRSGDEAITYKETEKLRKLDEAESIQLLQTLVKQRKESIEQFGKGGRKDLADKETKEMAIIETYLPAGASEAEMDAAIAKAIAETSANSMKQMGAVVKAAKAALEGKSVDGKALSDRVRSRLS